MTRMETTLTPSVDLATCDREPIHIPGSIQPSGVLLALEGPELTLRQASRNAAGLFGEDVEALLGRPLSDLFGDAQVGTLRSGLAGLLPESDSLYLSTVTPPAGPPGESYHAIAHRWDGMLVLELEAAEFDDPASFRGLYPLVRSFLANLENVATVDELARLAAEEVRRITGFDRALIYRFDADWNGTVVAEDRNDELPSYLGLHFPASDIPAQARELYRRNRLRLIPDADYEPVPLIPSLNPTTGRPLDLTLAGLRSVSPVHVEYMKNMGTAASMSISILRDGALWGLISCHHKTPRSVPFEVRTACDFLGQVLSLQLAAREHRKDYEYRMSLKSIQARLLGSMANADDFVDGLVGSPDDLMAFAAAQGAAVVFGGRCALVGTTPDEPRVIRLVDWLAEAAHEEVFASDRLADLIPEARTYAEQACGLLAVSISKLHRSYVVWFRPEVVQTVHWGGNPRKPFEPGDGDSRLHPRRSFDLWKETVRLRSLPWRQAELDTAAELRNAIVGIVLRRAEEMAQLSAELKRSNRELEAFSYSVSHDLRAPFRHIVGYSELLLGEPGLSDEARRYAGTIIESAQYAGVMVDSLLAFSQMGRAAIHPVSVDMDRLVAEVRQDVSAEAEGRRITWKVGSLPMAVCDPLMMRLALRNLLSNAVKYTRPRDEAVIEVSGESHPTENVYSFRDNGVGFDMRYVDKLFGVFQRLHRMEDFEGTGIGLANVRRIVERHGGRAWAEGAEDAGATFSIALPRVPRPEEA